MAGRENARVNRSLEKNSVGDEDVTYDGQACRVLGTMIQNIFTFTDGWNPGADVINKFAQ